LLLQLDVLQYLKVNLKVVLGGGKTVIRHYVREGIQSRTGVNGYPPDVENIRASFLGSRPTSMA